MIDSTDEAARTVEPGPTGPRPRPPGPEEGWASRQVAAMAAAWARGEPVTAAEVITRHPGLDAEAAIRLIYEEASLRREAGLEVDTAEVLRRFPDWADELRDLFDCDRLLRPSGCRAAFPEVDETLGPFLLLAELGRGASGRTFLATDPTLADRPVVVKVIAGDQDEHLALAPLRHTHIVPLFSEHSLPERGLRLLCMPDLGGTSLAEILAELSATPIEQRSGRRLVEALDRRARPLPSATAPATAPGPFRRALEQSTHADAITWVAACLADALHHAHARGIVHMDLKPSNVLIAADGQPMLLDFHLARGPIADGERISGRLGGTPGWMAPEQEVALAAAVEGRPAPAAVDGRADLYALGLLLREALMIPGPDRPGPADPTDFRCPAGVGVALADIVRKCLADAPCDRYADAAALAEDLRRQLDDLPLRGVRNRDPVERWRKWRRRHPGAFAWGIAGLSALAALAVAVAAGVAAHGQRVDRVRAALEDGRRLEAAGRHDEAARALAEGLERADELPAIGGLREALDRQLRISRRAGLAEELHALADSVRLRHGLELPAPEEARALLRLCRALWDRRAVFAAAGGPAPDPATERRIRADLIELAAVQLDLLLRLAPPGGAEASRREALGLLDEAEAVFGPSYALETRRAQLGGGPAADAGGPRTAWEHVDQGRLLLRSGRVEAAEAEFRRAAEIRPQDFWANYDAGLCAYRLGRFEAAASAFHTCVALSPGSAYGYYNRGLALAALGRADAADRDYARALDLDPGLAPAWLNRGILAYGEGRHRAAVAELRARPPVGPRPGDARPAPLQSGAGPARARRSGPGPFARRAGRPARPRGGRGPARRPALRPAPRRGSRCRRGRPQRSIRNGSSSLRPSTIRASSGVELGSMKRSWRRSGPSPAISSSSESAAGSRHSTVWKSTNAPDAGCPSTRTVPTASKTGGVRPAPRRRRRRRSSRVGRRGPHGPGQSVAAWARSWAVPVRGVGRVGAGPTRRVAWPRLSSCRRRWPRGRWR